MRGRCRVLKESAIGYRRTGYSFRGKSRAISSAQADTLNGEAISANVPRINADGAMPTI